MASVYEVEALSVGTRDRTLLEGVSFSLGAHERLVLEGRSGLGKTTLLRTLAALIDPLAGRITLSGKTPAQVGWPRYRSRVVLVSQVPAIFEGSVEDNLRRPFGFRCARGVFDDERARDLLQRAALDSDVFEQDASRLSVGQQQRVALVRALLLDPDLLLLDEPTSALDHASRGDVESMIESSAAAVIVVTHDRDFVGRLGAQRVDLEPCSAAAGAGS